MEYTKHYKKMSLEKLLQSRIPVSDIKFIYEVMGHTKAYGETNALNKYFADKLKLKKKAISAKIKKYSALISYDIKVIKDGKKFRSERLMKTNKIENGERYIFIFENMLDGKLSGIAIILFGFLYTFHRKNKIRVDINQFCSVMNKSRPTIYSTLEELQSNGYIKIENNFLTICKEQGPKLLRTRPLVVKNKDLICKEQGPKLLRTRPLVVKNKDLICKEQGPKLLRTGGVINRSLKQKLNSIKNNSLKQQKAAEDNLSIDNIIKDIPKEPLAVSSMISKDIPKEKQTMIPRKITTENVRRIQDAYSNEEMLKDMLNDLGKDEELPKEPLVVSSMISKDIIKEDEVLPKVSFDSYSDDKYSKPIKVDYKVIIEEDTNMDEIVDIGPRDYIAERYNPKIDIIKEAANETPKESLRNVPLSAAEAKLRLERMFNKGARI